ncbi:MAG TPA: tetratricopeptide repeat protein [Tepidisphaeraceae bacterium]|jgi:tetratricopeptide (TPR) repeat protein|nr:tetratricopeptide repeat protein [Tepidisphaeraceae bacterium]
MNSRIGLILATTAIGVAGCAAAPTARPAPTGLAGEAGVHNADVDARAKVSLDEIEPRAVLPPGKGTSVGTPPLEAVHLYAQAHEAILDHDRASAIDLMQKAVAADPQSYELHRALGELYLTPTTEFSDRSIAALEQAADLEPDHLDLQANLGRQYLAKGDTASALKHLRLALRTRQYASDSANASIAEFFLATLLRSDGYDQAALEVYQRLSRHLKSSSMSMRTNLEVAPLREHLDAIDADIADLLVLTGKYDQAIAAFAGQVELHPSNFELRSKQVHLLMVSHRGDAAVAAAQDAAVHFRANRESIALLDEACAAAGRTDGATAALSKLHEAHPNDHAILFALADLLRRDKRDAEADKILDAAAARDPADFEILRRRVEVKITAGARDPAANMLIEATALRPDLDAETAPLWSRLSRSDDHHRLRYPAIAALQVPKEQEASRSFWLWRLANAAHRDDVALPALERSLAQTPAFGPAYRDRVDEIWSRDDLTDDAKAAAVEALAAQAEASDKSLAAEVRGLGLARQAKFSDAADAFARAIELGGKSPDLMLSRAAALRKIAQESAADSLLWKVISDHPTLREAYEDLYLASIRRDMDSQADRVISTWLAADPDGVTARRIQAIQAMREGRSKAAETILLRLFNDHADDPEAVAAIGGHYIRRNAPEKFIALLQQRHAQEPLNMAVNSALIEALTAAHRPDDDAAAVIDAARAAAAGDPDLLYSISGLYTRVGKKEASESALADVLKLDPNHPGASNDLGYAWTEDGKNLPEAEALIRKAIEAEPKNVSYLDSMGWILYKRGKWAEAKEYLDRAIGAHESSASARPADPTVLDHRGDVLYRLGEKDAAAVDWQHAADHISALKDDADDDMKLLRGQLLEKARQEKAGEAVDVAPVPGKADSPRADVKTNAKADDEKLPK